VVLTVDEVIEQHRKERPSFAWQLDGEWVARGSWERWNSVKEVALGKKGWSILTYEGDIVFDDDTAREVDPDFLRTFLRTRPSDDRGRWEERLQFPARLLDDGWLYFQLKCERAEQKQRNVDLKSGRWFFDTLHSAWRCFL
jgi:hypothetical protein